MSNGNLFEDAASQLASQADAVGRLAQDSGAFAAAVAAFESQDPDAFRWVLDRIEMLPYCELICEWIRVKICVLRCFRICGVPRENVPTPDLQQFARAVVQLASNETLLRRVVDAVSCGDGDDFRAALTELKLIDYCHLLCHWVCSIIYRRVCERVCRPILVLPVDPVNEIRATAKVLATVVANEKALSEISKAAVAFDCVILRSAIAQAGFTPFCEILCRFICVWRCAWVCRQLCVVVEPPRAGINDIEEARAFALAARQLAIQPRQLGVLVDAVQNHDAKVYGELIARLGLGPYCFQVCAWVCYGICYEFCICVCPPPGYPPLFTQVGNFNIYDDIDPTSGRTNKGKSIGSLEYQGGPNFAFFGGLALKGICPIYSPTSPGAQMQYRFLYATASTSLAAAITAAQTSITVSSSAGVPPTPFDVSLCNPTETEETGETMTVTAVSLTTWTVVRGQDGTTAISAPAGSTLWINPRPITGSLVCQVQQGTRWVSWPTKDGSGNATTTNALHQQTVTIVPASPPPPDPIPPAPGAPWFPPTDHYITPDANGWIPIDENLVSPVVEDLMCFDTTQPSAVPGGCSISPAPCIDKSGGPLAGNPVPAANQAVGTDASIIFQATRVTAAPNVDYSNSLCKIHINNWSEVNNLWFAEFNTALGCCQPIDATLSVLFTVDHEEMNSGAWSIAITSCSASAPGDVICVTSLDYDITATQTSIVVANLSPVGTPPVPFDVSLPTTGESMSVTGVSGTTWTVVRGVHGTTNKPAGAGAPVSYQSLPGATVTPRGGWGTIVENTSGWTNCSYLVALSTRPGLTNGINDREYIWNYLTFCICGHGAAKPPAAALEAKKR
ncbi:MAG TPA: hypothetical protein VMU45_02490 [Candidatus Eisenbacteria bacterium]|nr:hypothetical protein [Candidatus Eisenbacteria bacterium]